MELTRFRQLIFLPGCLLLAVIAQAGNAVEASLTQGIRVYDADQYRLTFRLVLSITGSETIAEGDFGISLGPFDATDVISRDPSFNVQYVQQEKTLHLNLSRMSLASGQNVSYTDILLYVPWGTPISEYGVGFGEFSFLQAELKDLDGLPVSDVSLTVGSWYVMTDAFETIPVRLLEADRQTPVTNAWVVHTGMIGGAGIGDGRYLTDSRGYAGVIYPAIPCFGDFYMENGRWIVKSMTKVWAVFRIESGDDTSLKFDPIEVVVELRINDPPDGSWRLFKEVTIVVGGPSGIEDWGLYE
ncbi:MAG TPA: hypothetical protein PLZ55_06855 [bacterium]|nr:hypothetical protein [bacterium]